MVVWVFFFNRPSDIEHFVSDLIQVSVVLYCICSLNLISAVLTPTASDC